MVNAKPAWCDCCTPARYSPREEVLHRRGLDCLDENTVGEGAEWTIIIFCLVVDSCQHNKESCRHHEKERPVPNFPAGC